MATTRWALLESVVIVTFFISSQVELSFSEGVAYSLFNSDSELDSVISFGQHHTLYKRQSGNLSDPTTAPPTTASKSPTTQPQTTTQLPTTTPDYTEQKLSQNHKYYKSKVITTTAEFPNYWTELYNVKHSEPLSGSHRVAVSVPINFKFKFYGHEVTKITIATGGFLYMSPFLHQWLTATQYIAPLMANFDTSMNNDSIILYKDFGDKFVVEWQRVFLQDQNHTNPFSFQTTLHTNGTIYFAYRDVPVEVFNIEVKNHPVKVGVSDAFYIDTIQGVKSKNTSHHRYSDSNEGVQRRTIYEYHRVEVDFKRVRSQSVVILEPLATCNIAKDCNTCLTQDDSFDCKWCPQVSRCSDGIDWKRQEWRDRGCEIQGFDKVSRCNLSPMTHSTVTSAPPTKKAIIQPDCSSSRSNCSFKSAQKSGDSATIAGVVVAVIILVALVVGIGGWFFYAYTHPTSASGQWMINHRPSEMKAKMSKMKFWKKDSGTGEKYRVESQA
ncbi:plexin domain-containing protein 2-like isoform X3 [Saccostrea cucullata]|uniref:plexin domain-containing protein 2-like isoform X3 n=1 Tax=Saccostrea cuccullata TaxID=36930 RepID=UPI002ED2939C